MISAVLDANVLLSGIVGVDREQSTPGAIVRAWREERFVLVISSPIAAEVERNLTHDPYFTARWSPDRVVSYLRSLTNDATQITTWDPVAGVATHREDDLVLATAVSAAVDYLVTGDRQLQSLRSYHGVTIVSPRAFLGVLESHAPESHGDQAF